MAIFITGDAHGEITKFSSKRFIQQKELTKSDYVIVLGDFGMLWSGDKSDKYKLDWLESKNFTTLFIDGNHENFDLINEYPTVEWNGGKVHMIRPSVIHLCRGQVFNLQGKKFFTFGGAESHDIQGGVIIERNKIGQRFSDVAVLHKLKPIRSISDTSCYEIRNEQYSRKFHAGLRLLNVSWWPDELPNKLEMDTGANNLASHRNTVDYILTHCAPSKIQSTLFNNTNELNYFTDYLEQIYRMVNFKKWYCGHYHQDRVLRNNFTILYNEILRIL